MTIDQRGNFKAELDMQRMLNNADQRSPHLIAPPTADLHLHSIEWQRKRPLHSEQTARGAIAHRRQ